MRSRVRLLSLWLCCLTLATNVYAQVSGPGVLPGAQPASAGGSVSGPIREADGTAAAPSYSFASDPTSGFYRGGSGQMNLSSSGTLRYIWDGTFFYIRNDSAAIKLGAADDLVVARDGANSLALRNSTNAQTFALYNTYTDASNYERGRAYWSSNVLVVGETSAAGTGTVRSSRVFADTLRGNAGGITVSADGTSTWSFSTAGGGGAFIPTTDNTRAIGSQASRPSSLWLAGPSVTAGSATGLTINDVGQARELIYKITLDKSAFVCAATTCDVTIGTLPANTWLVNVTASLTQTFACTATCTTATLSAVLGKGAGGAEYLASLDADAATAVFGDADAELGSLMTRAAAIQGGTFNTGSQAVVFRLVSGTGNIGNGAATNLSQGSITVWLTTRVLP